MAAAVVYISSFFYALVETVQGMPWHVMPEILTLANVFRGFVFSSL